MTKVGENNLPPRVETKEHNQKKLEVSLLKFEEGLEKYKTSRSNEEQVHIKGIMDGQLGLIKQSSSEILRQGVHKQEVKVEKNYHSFLETGSDESYAALKHDIQTLRDYTARG
jgi:hypothetical protein